MNIPEIHVIPDVTQMIVQLASLMILLFVFKRFGWKPTKAFLDKRKEIVAAEFKAAEDAKASAIALKTEYDAKIQNASADSAAIIEKAKEEAKHESIQIVTAAKEEADARLEAAESAIELDKRRAYAEVKDEVIRMTMKGVETLVKKEVDANSTEALFNELLTEVGEMGHD